MIIKNVHFLYCKQPLSNLRDSLLLITTLNAHSYNVAREDTEFAEALQGSDILLPDGISIVWAVRFLTGKKLNKIAGENLFYYEMRRLNTVETQDLTSVSKQDEIINTVKTQCLVSVQKKSKVFFLGSSEEVLQKIKGRAGVEFPNVEVYTYSPPYKHEFTDEDNAAMYAAINAVQPDVLFVGMTAPKQEKWAYKLMNSWKLEVESIDLGERSWELGIHNSRLQTTNYKLSCHVCCIGAVFDFYAGTVKRAPQWMIKLGLEWFYRLIKEPKRMWRRYLIGNLKFMWAILLEKFSEK